jgi:phosphohistidine phosphatase SixA
MSFQELVATKIACTVAQSDSLGPNDSPEKMLAVIRSSRPEANAVLIAVGHLPQLSLLAGLMEFDLISDKDFPTVGGLLIEVRLA